MHKFIHFALALGFASLGSTAFAAPSRDGLWSVQFVTESGSCAASYNSSVAIENGSVRPLEAGMSVSGQVAPNGQVSLLIRRSIAQADATGRLSAKSGSGTWRLALLGCQGRWTAAKAQPHRRS